MGNFDIEYSQASPTVVKMPRASMNVDTGAGAIGQGLQGLGNAGFEIGQKIQHAENAMELSTLRMTTEEKWNSAYQTMKDIKDPEERAKFYQKARQDISSVKAKNGKVDNAFQMYLHDNLPAMDVRYTELDNGLRIRSAKDQLEFNGQFLLEKGDAKSLDDYRQLLAVARKTDLIGDAEFQKKFDDASGDSFIMQARRKIDTDPEFALSVLQDPETRKQLNNDQLNDADSLITRALSTKNRANLALKDTQDKQKWDLYKKSEDLTLTKEEVDNSVLSPEDKIYIWQNYQSVQVSKSKGEVSSIENSDPMMLAKVNSIIDLHPESVTTDGIYKMIGNGIGTKDVTGLVDRLNKNKAEKNPIAAKFKAELSRLLSAGTLGKKEKLETSNKFLDMQYKLEQFLAKNPTDEQTQTFFNGLVKENQSGWVEGIKNLYSGFKEKTIQAYESPAGYVMGGPFAAKKIYDKLTSNDKTNAPIQSPKPAEYPDAVWNEKHNMWTVVRDGKLMGVK